MAKIILGTIVTSIRGSIAGNTFRKTKTGFSLGLKSFGGSKEKRQENPVLSKIQYVLGRWKNFSTTEKNNWQIFANATPIINKYGETVYLSGRQMFNKVNIQGIPIDAYNDNTSSANTVVSAINVDICQIRYISNQVTLELSGTVNPCRIVCYVQETSTKDNKPNFKKAVNIGVIIATPDYADGLTDLFYAKFPTVSALKTYYLWLQPINQFGWKATPTIIKMPQVAS